MNIFCKSQLYYVNNSGLGYPKENIETERHGMMSNFLSVDYVVF